MSILVILIYNNLWLVFFIFFNISPWPIRWQPVIVSIINCGLGLPVWSLPIFYFFRQLLPKQLHAKFSGVCSFGSCLALLFQKTSPSILHLTFYVFQPFQWSFLDYCLCFIHLNLNLSLRLTFLSFLVFSSIFLSFLLHIFTFA